MRPWQDSSYLFSLMTIMLSVLVAATVTSEFVRGGRVIARHTSSSLAAGMLQLTRRNTRRYGGYIVHFGVIVIMIGFAGAAFNKDVEHELGNGQQMSIGPYTLACRSYTDDDNPNYRSQWAIIDVSKNGKPLATMYPERRFYKASQQTATIVANRSTLREDLYLVYSGLNDETGQADHPRALEPAGAVDLDWGDDRDRRNRAWRWCRTRRRRASPRPRACRRRPKPVGAGR